MIAKLVKNWNPWGNYARFMIWMSKSKPDPKILKKIVNYLSPETSSSKSSVAKEKGFDYRNGCCYLAALGVITFCLAILPYALEFSEPVEQILGISELVSFMVAVKLVKILMNKKDQWTRNRGEAEVKRYEKMRNLLDKQPESDELKRELEQHISNQLAHNKERIVMYEAIETGSNKFSWVLFFLTFCASLGHVLFHWEWLILLTAGLPIIVAAIHAMNTFTDVQRQLAACKRIYAELYDIEKEFHSGKCDLKILGESLLAALTKNDLYWNDRIRAILVSP